MQRISFDVEQIVIATGRGVLVVARWLGPEPVGELRNATLGGAPIEPWTDIPRSLDERGVPRADLFAFQLQNAGDHQRFAPGQRVDLITP